jgi:hypothetical protein
MSDDRLVYMGVFFGIVMAGPLCWALGWGRGFAEAQRMYRKAGHGG